MGYSSITMVGTSTVTSKGQVTIPEAVRRYLDIRAGSRVYFEVEPEKMVARIRRAPKSVVEELAGSLHSSVPYMDISIARQKAGEELKKIYGTKKD